LEDEGAVVQIASHGREGVEAIAAARPAFDVVLMDLQMPVMDGITATRYVRQNLEMTTLPIVAMTANAMASDREACLAAGMNDHVGKPFDLNNLVQVLRRQAGWFATEHHATVAEPILSSAQSQAALAAGVDLDTALRRLGGKHEVYQRMLASFVHDLQALPHKLQAYATARDSESLVRAMHTLKGLAATLGADALSHAAGRSEKLATSANDAATLAHSANTLCDVIVQAAPTLHALAQAWAPPAQVRVVDATLDAEARQALRSKLHHLTQQLTDSDMDAMNTMAEIQQRFGDALGAAIAPLEAEMSALEFEAALPHCQALLCSLNRGAAPCH
jgi:CheY-like chemotaxis protein